MTPAGLTLCRTCLLSILLTSLLVHAAPRPLAADLPAVPIPAGSNLFARLQKAHPRLLATPSDFAQLKHRVASDSQLKSWHTRLQAQTQDILQAPPSRYEIPDGKRLLATSRRVLQRVYTLALLFRLDGEKRYAERAWQELAAAASFSDWNPRHFLDTAEMTHAFAVGYDWLYEVWTPAQRATLQQAMVDKGLKPALKVYEAHNWWARSRHNWNQVCNGGIGMGALALADVEPQLAGEALHNALVSVQLAMAEFAPDGAWKEGPGYWSYATFYNVVLLAGLETALGTDFGLSGIEAFNHTGLFPIYISGPLGRTFNYADGGDGAVHGPQLFWLARKFKQPVCAWHEQRRPAPEALDLLWFDPTGLSPQAAGLGLDKRFKGAEVVSLRSDWKDYRALFVGFKAGDNRVNHSHLDLGSFVLDAAGVRWALDLGGDNYNLPAYFGSQRWDYYRLRAEGHNTLVINPDAKPDQDPKADTKIIRFESRPNRAFAIADLTPAYARNAQRVWRGISLLDRDTVLVQDEIQANKPVELWWFMHTRASVKIEGDGRVAHLAQDDRQLDAEILSPAGAKFQVMDARPLDTSPQPEGQTKNQRARKLAIHLASLKDARLAVRLVPQPAKDRAASQTVRLSALSEW